MSIARELMATRRFMLAGALTPECVATTVELAKPCGVDVPSGVETHGLKDVGKTRTFIREVRSFPQQRIG